MIEAVVYTSNTGETEKYAKTDMIRHTGSIIFHVSVVSG